MEKFPRLRWLGVDSYEVGSNCAGHTAEEVEKTMRILRERVVQPFAERVQLVMARSEDFAAQGFVAGNGNNSPRGQGKAEKVGLSQFGDDDSDDFWPVDLLFVDADHTYSAALRDLKLYSPMVRPGGVVAGHDYADGTWFKGVVRAVHETLPEGKTLHLAPDGVFWWYA